MLAMISLNKSIGISFYKGLLLAYFLSPKLVQIFGRIMEGLEYLPMY
jgi:hypothetical protein